MDWTLFEFLAPAIVASLIIAGIHAYLGLHVVEPYFDLKTPNSIANQVGGKVLVLAPSVGGTAEATDYIQLFEYNVKTIAAALQQVTGK